MKNSQIRRESVFLHDPNLLGTGFVPTFEWKSYSVKRAAKQPLLDFILRGLEMRGCIVLYASPSTRAPFYIVFDSPTGERQGILVYAFFANSRPTLNRPKDEHRFQIKYGSDLKTILEVGIDPQQLVTTLFIGIDPEEEVFVAADPLMNSPSPMSRSVEFKKENVEAIHKVGWVAWERDRRQGKAKDRATADLEDERTEVLIGAKQERLLDLITLERTAFGLDPGERHLVADKFRMLSSTQGVGSHALVQELGLTPDELFDLIQGTSRLRMAVRGWVAEQHLVEELKQLDGVTDCARLLTEGQPDISLRWRGGAPILIECKNSLRVTYSDGTPKVDFQRTRASKGDPCSRYYRPSDFPVLAACLHAVTENWEFRFALTSELPPHSACNGRIGNLVRVQEPTFVRSATEIFGRYSEGDVA